MRTQPRNRVLTAAELDAFGEELDGLRARTVTIKVRYKGLAKNAAQVFTLVGLTNLYLARRAMLT